MFWLMWQIVGIAVGFLLLGLASTIIMFPFWFVYKWIERAQDERAKVNRAARLAALELAESRFEGRPPRSTPPKKAADSMDFKMHFR